MHSATSIDANACMSCAGSYVPVICNLNMGSGNKMEFLQCLDQFCFIYCICRLHLKDGDLYGF